MASLEPLDVYGGIEGGGTKTTVVLIDPKGNIISEAEGLSSNHWMIGLEECAKRIDQIVREAKLKAGLDVSRPIKALGLSMSGADSKEARQDIENSLKVRSEVVSQSYFVCCDTVGAVSTASEKGGVVLIAGTGSNCEVVNTDGSQHRVGGWGHAIGDEGSAFWITYYCLKKLFDIDDNFDSSDTDVTFVRQTMCGHFGVRDRMDFLNHLYPTLNKTRFAAMCEEIARGANDLKDPLCIEAFYQAGRWLGLHILGLAPKINESLFLQDGGLKIVCVGSVWKSWDLLKKGFLQGIKPRNKKDVDIKELTLLKLLKPGHVGAAYLGARAVSHTIPADYSSNAEIFFHFKK